MTVDTTLLAKSVPGPVIELCTRLKDSGFRSWVVGGCVRDLLLAGSQGHLDASSFRGDFDVATDARPEQVQKLFRRVIPTGIKHGTVTVLLEGEGYEVTTLRGETTYTDGRHPDQVFFVRAIEDDLARRDFTVNAMAWDPLAQVLVDPFGGLEDLQRRLLRAVGDAAQRFAEDGLRVLRAARFVATLELELEETTARAIQPSLDSYAKVSPERIRDEWLKAMKAPRPSRAFEVMRQHGMLAISAPEILPMVGCQQNRYHAFDVWTHTLAVLDQCPPDPVLRLAALLHDLGKPSTRALNDKTEDYTFYEHEVVGAQTAGELLTRLRFSTAERDRVVALIRHHLVRYDESWADGTVRRWLRRVGPELVDDLIELNRADLLGKGRDVTVDLERMAQLRTRIEQVVAAGAAMSIGDLGINGNDLMKELGLRPGPLLGSILRRLLEEVTDNPERNSREVLIARARELQLEP